MLITYIGHQGFTLAGWGGASGTLAGWFDDALTAGATSSSSGGPTKRVHHTPTAAEPLNAIAHVRPLTIWIDVGQVHAHAETTTAHATNVTPATTTAAQSVTDVQPGLHQQELVALLELKAL